MTRLVTPGTITEEKLLDPSEANFLMTLGRTKGDGALALAWIDISTGTFRVAETTEDRLLPMLPASIRANWSSLIRPFTMLICARPLI